MKRSLLITLCVIGLSGCAPSTYQPSPEQQQLMADAKRKDAEFAIAVKNINLEAADVGVAPKNHKKLIEDAIRNLLKDPDSAKFTGLTAPRKEVMVENHAFVYGYASCVNVNAKNSYGGYTGNSLYWVFYRNNIVLRIKNTEQPPSRNIFVGRKINCN